MYGQGNFLFNNNNEYWNSGILVKIIDQMEIEYIPFVKNKECVRKASGLEQEQLMMDFHKRSRDIIDPQFVINEFKKLSSSMEYTYKNVLISRIASFFY